MPEAYSCELGDEPSGSIKDEEFRDQLSDCYLLKDAALFPKFKLITFRFVVSRTPLDSLYTCLCFAT